MYPLNPTNPLNPLNLTNPRITKSSSMELESLLSSSASFVGGSRKRKSLEESMMECPYCDEDFKNRFCDFIN